MLNHTKEQICNININQLFDIIIDVEKYPEFLPWCIASRILSRNEKTIYADLMIRFYKITEKYTSKISLIEDIDKKLIITESVKGPFKKLDNIWTLKKINDNHTYLKFDISFEFKSKLLNNVIRLFFDKAIEKMTSSFENRIIFLKSTTENS